MEITKQDKEISIYDVEMLRAKFTELTEQPQPVLFGVRKRSGELSKLGHIAGRIHANAITQQDRHEAYTIQLEAMSKANQMLADFYIS